MEQEVTGKQREEMTEIIDRKPLCRNTAWCRLWAEQWSAPHIEQRQHETDRQLGILVGCAQSHEIPVGRSVHSVSFHPLNLFSQLAEGFI